MTSILDRTDLVEETRDIPLAQIDFSPEKNYRWGSEEAMKSDLAGELVVDGDERISGFRLLVSSMKATGNALNPIGVQRNGKRFDVIFGFNRYLAAKEAGLSSLRSSIYRDGLPIGIIESLQAVENSENLRRSVNWVQECRMWERLLKHAEFEVQQMPDRDRPKSKKGRLLSVTSAAWLLVAQRIGRSELTMKERMLHMQRIDPRVLDMAVAKSWSYQLTHEFYSGDADHPYPPEFVTYVLDEIKRSDPNLTNTTPAAVSRAKQRVKQWMASGSHKGKAPWRSKASANLAEDASLRRVTLGTKLSPPSLRDASVNMMFRAITSMKLTAESPKSSWESTKKTVTAYRVAGIGIGAGDVLLPDGSDDIRQERDFADADVRCANYVMTATVAAGVRRILSADNRMDWPKWFTSDTHFGSSKRSNRYTFWTAVEGAVRENTEVLPAVMHAITYLRDAGVVNG